MDTKTESFSPNFQFITKRKPGNTTKMSTWIEVVFYELVFIENKEDIQYINEIEKKVQVGEIVLRRPKDKVRAFTNGTNYRVAFELHVVPDFINEFPSFFMPTNIEKFRLLFSKLKETHINETVDVLEKKIIISTIIMEMLKESVIDTQNNIISSSLSYIHQNYLKKITIDEIAKASNISSSYFHQYFKRKYHTSPFSYINKLRMQHASELMANRDLNISQIAYSCGFESISYFNKLFKKHYKLSPLQYKNKFYY